MIREDSFLISRSQVMTPGRCSLCLEPAEQHVVSKHWWHTGTSCRPCYGVLPAHATPLGPDDQPLPGSWPARFEPAA